MVIISLTIDIKNKKKEIIAYFFWFLIVVNKTTIPHTINSPATMAYTVILAKESFLWLSSWDWLSVLSGCLGSYCGVISLSFLGLSPILTFSPFL